MTSIGAKNLPTLMEEELSKSHQEDATSTDENAGGHRASNNGIMTSAKETSRIRMFRLMVGGMLGMTAAVTVTAYFLLDKEENRNFETAYAQFARTLGDAALEQQQSLRDSLQTLSNAVTAYAETANLVWPFVVLPLFESYAMDFMDLCHAEFVGVNNLVANEDQESYINFTNHHFEEWVQESHMIRYGNVDLLNQDASKYNAFISKKTKDKGFVPDDPDRDYYSVRSSQSPPMRAFGPTLNLNIATLGTNGQVIDGVLALRNETLVTPIRPFSALPAEEHKNFHTDSGEGNEDGDVVDHPHSFMIHPIYEHVRDPGSAIVGTIVTSVAWDASMRNLLPNNVQGILCVVKNTCDQSFTYEVHGQSAFYLGEGDLHDSKYDYLEVMVDLSMHTHPDLTTALGHCQYTMHMYPTDLFRDDYTTALPETFAAVVAVSFMVVAIVFFVYDWLVQRRNKELATTAARSDKLVSSLFPGEIKDRILEEQDIETKTNDTSFKHPMMVTQGRENGDSNCAGGGTTRPLAMVYPDTTIMFADLAGFTSWSSTRTPEQVFELLEALYSAFDAIAKRRRVFKVETIGDCYVAATGLPEPQSDHARIMVRFASDCIQKMNVLTVELTEKLGNDTQTLKMRVGLHSGSVTGGVLRGDKSRFQLFGDTMNTASRIESSGVAGRIHVSQATADELEAAGKESWLTPREQKIVAKGKGEMQTYFALVPATLAKSTTSMSTDESNTYDGQSEIYT